MDDWYGVSAKNITDFGGSRLLSKYNDSPFRLIQAVYSDHQWEIQKYSMNGLEMTKMLN